MVHRVLCNQASCIYGETYLVGHGLPQCRDQTTQAPHTVSYLVRRNYQVSVIGILYDDIVVTLWPHVSRSGNISGRTEAGPLHDAGRNFWDFRYIIPESSTVSKS